MKKSQKFIALCILSTLILTSCQGQETKNNESNMYLNTIPDEEYSRAISYYSDRSYPGNTLEEVLDNSTSAMISFIEALPDDKLDHRYKSGKWSVREVIQHVISYEQIMHERALIVAGKDIEQKYTRYYNQSTTVAPAGNKTKQELLEEFKKVRAITTNSFTNLSMEELTTEGTLDGFRVSVRMIAMCLSGHQKHHFNVIRGKYL
ncbi:DinB family protein [Flagellimonas meridianipacifica]|uniref:DinB family protein n=1 Tax=Flagellimonas meridianipacifica TaxID=1080225 RepID=A0A2T0M911_9FLAO|nr:DinB family protein [Allomuricauda pacifica]PRX54001.1 DinB family protein [Allomuricauda pacifica]